MDLSIIVFDSLIKKTEPADGKTLAAGLRSLKGLETITSCESSHKFIAVKKGGAWILIVGPTIIDTLNVYRHDDLLFRYIKWSDGKDIKVSGGGFLNFSFRYRYGQGRKWDTEICGSSIDFGPPPEELLSLAQKIANALDIGVLIKIGEEEGGAFPKK